MKCVECKYLDEFRQSYNCTHKDIKESFEKYQKKKNKKITKFYCCVSVNYNTLPKTSLRWCPLKG